MWGGGRAGGQAGCSAALRRWALPPVRPQKEAGPCPASPAPPPVPRRPTRRAPLMARCSELQPPEVRVSTTSSPPSLRCGSSATGSSHDCVYRKEGGKKAGASTWQGREGEGGEGGAGEGGAGGNCVGAAGGFWKASGKASAPRPTHHPPSPHRHLVLDQQRLQARDASHPHVVRGTEEGHVRDAALVVELPHPAVWGGVGAGRGMGKGARRVGSGRRADTPPCTPAAHVCPAPSAPSAPKGGGSKCHHTRPPAPELVVQVRPSLRPQVDAVGVKHRAPEEAARPALLAQRQVVPARRVETGRAALEGRHVLAPSLVAAGRGALVRTACPAACLCLAPAHLQAPRHHPRASPFSPSLGGSEEVADPQQPLLPVQIGDGSVHRRVERRDHCRAAGRHAREAGGEPRAGAGAGACLLLRQWRRDPAPTRLQGRDRAGLAFAAGTGHALERE